MVHQHNRVYIAIKKNEKDLYELIKWFRGYISEQKKQSARYTCKKEDKIYVYMVFALVLVKEI